MADRTKRAQAPASVESGQGNKRAKDGPGPESGGDKPVASRKNAGAKKAQPAADPTGQRARPDKDQRVNEIAAMMASGRWVTGVTALELAERWGVPFKTLEADAAEASRRIRAELSGNDDLRARLVATLETITERAMQRGQLRTAVESVKTLAGVAGAEAPKRVDVGGNLAELLNLGLGPGPGAPEGGGGEPDPEVGT